MWKEKLAAKLEEEGHDHDEYMDLAEEAEKEGCHHEAGVLRDMAREEKMHHRLIKEMM